MNTMYRLSITALAVGLVARVVYADIPDGFEVVDVAQAESTLGVPRMNDCAQIMFSKVIVPVVWTDILSYDNGALETAVTDGDSNISPDVNNDGATVWTSHADSYGGGQINLLVDGVLDVLAEGTRAAMNDISEVTWNRFLGTTCIGESDVFLFSDDTIIQITDNGLSNQSAEINDAGWVVFWKANLCPNPWVSRIMLYRNDQVEQLPFSLPQPRGPTINNRGQVAWDGVVGIELWQQGVTTLFTDWGANPRLNNLGDMYFLRFDEALASWQAWLYLSGEFFQLTNEPFPVWNTAGDINDYGEVVWRRRNFETQVWRIRYMRRIRTGEADFDGHIDLRDFAAFQNCMTGPGDFDGTEGGFDRLCDCRFLDLDHDRDVDADDFALFQQAMAGPQ